MNESQKIAKVHSFLPPRIIKWKMAGGYFGANGIPDAYYAGLDGDLWVEYKNLILPARGSTVVRPDLSALQKKALKTLFGLGIRCEVIVFTNQGAFVLDTPGQWDNGVTKDDLPSLLTYQEVANHIYCAITGEEHD